MTRLMAMELITTLMAPYMKVIGLMTSNMAKVKKVGKTVQPSKESMQKVRSTELVTMNGMTVLNILVIGMKIKSMVSEHIAG